MELRKHITDMTQYEIGYLENLTAQYKIYDSNIYFLRTLAYRKISYDSVVDTIHNGQIIELHIKNKDVRILKRSKNHITERLFA